MPDPLTMPLFNFAEDWSTMRLRIAFASSIETSDNGSETRDSLSIQPSLGIEFAVREEETHALAKGLERFARRYLGSAFLVPIWSEAVVLTGAVTTQTIPVTSTANRLWKTGRYAALIRNAATNHESPVTNHPSTGFTLGAISANSIVAATSIEHEFWQAGDVVVPLIQVPAYVSETEIGWFHAAAASASVTFMEDAATADSLPTSNLSPLLTYNGIPIWPIAADWPEAEALRASDAVPFVELAVDSGVRSITTLSTLARRSVRLNCQLDSRAAIGAAITTFAAVRGRARRLWVPSNRTDFVKLAAAHNGGNILLCQNSGHVSSGENSGHTRRTVLVFTNTGWHVRQVTSAAIALDGINEQLTLDAAVPGSVVHSIEWLHLCRFTTDDLLLSFYDAEHASAEINLLELPDEYPAALDGAVTVGGNSDDWLLLP